MYNKGISFRIGENWCFLYFMQDLLKQIQIVKQTFRERKHKYIKSVECMNVYIVYHMLTLNHFSKRYDPMF